MSRPYRAFISYNHADEKWAGWLHRSLERFRIPGKLVAQYELESNRLSPIFRDRDELSSSSSLSSEIEAALEASEHLIVICSPSAANSRWVNEEIRSFQTLGRSKQVLCLLVDGADGECIPALLRADEPLGADVRPGGDGKQNAKLKIIAGLLGIRFAELKDRQARRRNQVFGVAAAGSLAVAGVMTALAVNAVLAGREAERNRLLATDALADSEQVASFLAEMLVELDPEAIGQTIIDDLGEQAPEIRFPPEISSTDTARRLLDEHLLNDARQTVLTQFAEQPSINARLQRSIGDAYHAIGLYDKSIEANANALQLHHQIYGGQDERTLEASRSLDVSRLFQGQLEEAITSLEQTLDISRQALGRNHPQTAQIMAALAAGYLDVGRNQEALDLLEPAADKLVAEYGPENEEVIGVRATLAWALYQLQDYAAAEELNLELLDTQRRVLGPEAYETLITLNNLGLIYSRMGDFDKAVGAHREELTISRRTLGADHPEVLVSTLNLARATLNAEQFEAADELFLEAYETGTRILPPVHPLRAAVTFAYGEASARVGGSEKAGGLYLTARTIYEQIFELDHPVFARLDERLAELELE